MKTLFLTTVVFVLTITLVGIAHAVCYIAFELEQKYGKWAFWLVLLLFLFGFTYVLVFILSGTIKGYN